MSKLLTSNVNPTKLVETFVLSYDGVLSAFLNANVVEGGDGSISINADYDGPFNSVGAVDNVSGASVDYHLSLSGSISGSNFKASGNLTSSVYLPATQFGPAFTAVFGGPTTITGTLTPSGLPVADIGLSSLSPGPDGVNYGELDSELNGDGPAQSSTFSLLGDQAEIQLAENAQGAITNPAQSGSLSFSDSGASALPSFEIASGGVTATDSHGNSVELTDDQQNAILSHLTINSASGGPNGGSFTWTFDPSGTDLNFLVNQEVVSLRQTVEATDSNGNTADADLNIQLDGPQAAEAGIDMKFYPGPGEVGDEIMQNLISTTNLKWTGFYLTPAPSQSRKLGWMPHAQALKDQGWNLAPIYVGRQADHTKQDGLAIISNAPHGATQQGIIDAHQAVDLARKAKIIGGTIYLDVEAQGDIVSGDSKEKSYIASWCRAVKQQGFNPGIYCPASTAVALRTIAPNATYWIANTIKSDAVTSNIDTTSAPGYVFPENNPSQSNFRGASAWQYAQKQSIDGINQAVDFNTFNGSSAGLVASVTSPNSADVASTYTFSENGEQTISDFHLLGSSHDVLSLPSASFGDLADVLRNTQNTAAGVTITDPTNGNTLQIAGLTKAELKANKQDFVFS